MENVGKAALNMRNEESKENREKNQIMGRDENSLKIISKG